VASGAEVLRDLRKRVSGGSSAVGVLLQLGEVARRDVEERELFIGGDLALMRR
jgi:hypothetical protein